MTSASSKNSPTLTSNRLILRRFVPEDTAALLRLLQDPEVNTFLPWSPLQTMEQAAQFLQQRYLDSYSQPVGYRYAICLKEDTTPIGYINVGEAPSYDLGYGLCREYWHQGIVSEAAACLLQHLRQQQTIPYLTATHDVNNPHSGDVMKKIGMHYCYSYREQWQPKDISVVFRMYQCSLDGASHPVYREYWDRYPHWIEKLS